MTPTIYTYDSLWGHYNSQEVGIVRSGAGRYLCGWIVIIVTNKNLLSQMKCVEARGRETPGFFVLSYHFGRGTSTRGLDRGTSTGGFSRVLQQGYINRGPRQGCFGRVTSAGALQQGHSERGHSERGHSERGASTFSKYYEFPVTINGNIRLYCGTTRERLQEKAIER